MENVCKAYNTNGLIPLTYKELKQIDFKREKSQHRNRIKIENKPNYGKKGKLYIIKNIYHFTFIKHLIVFLVFILSYLNFKLINLNIINVTYIL